MTTTTTYETAAHRLLTPQSGTGQMIARTETHPEHPGWQGLWYGDLFVGEVYPWPRDPGRWVWRVWIGNPADGREGDCEAARAAMWRELGRRPVDELRAE